MTTPEHEITAAEALDRARAAHDSKWLPVPGYSAPTDTVGNSYRQGEFSTGWIFTPLISNISTDPRVASAYDLYVVRRDGATAVVPYDQGQDAAQAFLLVI